MLIHYIDAPTSCAFLLKLIIHFIKRCVSNKLVFCVLGVTLLSFSDLKLVKNMRNNFKMTQYDVTGIRFLQGHNFIA